MNARKLQRRAHRSETGAFLLEGPAPVLEALQMGGARIDDLFVEVGCAAEGQVMEAAASSGARVTPVTRSVLVSIAETSTPQGVVAVVSPPDHELGSLDLALGPVLVLADVRDPGNAGTLVRSALAAGATAAIFGRRSVDPWNPKAVRAASGALLRMPVLRDEDLDGTAAELRRRDFRLIGTDAGAPRSYDRVDLTGPVAFWLGNEAWGLPEDARHLVDELVSIPMPGPAESLNVSIAGSILLFETVRQRRSAEDSSFVGEGPGDYPQPADERTEFRRADLENGP